MYILISLYFEINFGIFQYFRQINISLNCLLSKVYTHWSAAVEANWKYVCGGGYIDKLKKGCYILLYKKSWGGGGPYADAYLK